MKSLFAGVAMAGLTVILVGGAAPAQAQFRPARDGQTTQTWTGRVTSTETRQPMPGTTVTLRGLRMEVMQRAMIPSVQDIQDLATTATDSAGRYLFDVVPQVSPFMWVEATTTDGLRGSGSVNPAMGFLERNSSKRTVDIMMRQAGLVEGDVQDDFGKPMTSVTVRMSLVITPQSFNPMALVSDTTQTNGQGRFRFPQAIHGTSYQLIAETEGYLPATVEVTAPSSGTVLKLREGGASMAGVLLDFETRRPMAATTIGLMLLPKEMNRRFSMPTPKRTTTNEAGQFDVQGLSGGHYMVNVEGKGYRVMENKGSIRRTPHGPPGIALADGESTAGLEIHAFQGYTIEGRVEDLKGKPIVGAEVSSQWPGAPGGNPEQTDITNEGGRFQIKADSMTSVNNVPNVIVRATKSGYKLKLEGSRDNPGGPGQYVPVEGESVRVKNVVLKMEEALLVSGRVLTGSTPVANAHIKWWTNRNQYFPGGGEGNTIRTDKKGQFSIEVAPDEKGVVEARHPDFGSVVSEEVLVEDRSTTIPDLVLKGFARISGVVQGPDGKPFASATVNGYSMIAMANMNFGNNPDGFPLTTDQDGRFQHAKVPADLAFTLSANAPEYAPSVSQQFTLASGESKDDLVLKLQVPLTITGRVVNGKKQPLADVSINAHSRNGSDHTMSDKDGRFTLKNLGAGNYDIYCSSSMGQASGQKRGVAAGTKDLELVLQERNPERPKKSADKVLLKGTVVDSDTKKKIPGIEVRESHGTNGAVIGFSPDDPGEFTAEISSEQSLRLTITAPGYAPLNTDWISISGGEPLIERTFELEKGRSVQGRLVVDKNQPLKGVRVRLLMQGERWMAFQADPVKTTRSDDQGRFTFDSLRSGLQRLDIRPESPLATMTHEFTVTPGQSPQDLGDIVVGTGGTLNVTVKSSSTKKGLPGYNVQAYMTNGNSNERRVKVSDKEGLAVLDKLAAGDYSINVYGQDSVYVSYARQIKIESGKAEDVVVEIGTASLPGKLVRANEGIEGSIILRALKESSQNYHTQASSGSGEFKVAGMLPGEYEATGQTWGQNGNSSVKAKVTVREGTNPELILRLPAGVVSGVVVDPAGTPVEGASVGLSSSTPRTGDDSYLQYSSNLVSESDGTFRFEGVTPGTYGLTARKDGVGFALESGIQVAAGDGKVENLKVVLKKDGGTLVSVALDIETGRGIPEAWCHLSNAQGRYPHGATRKSDGTMTIENIPEGTYNVQVSSFGYSAEDKQVEIRKGETTRMESVLYVAGALRWTLSPIQGATLDGVKLRLTPDDPNSLEEPRSGTVDGQGTWVVRGLAPGQFTGTIQREGKPDIKQTINIIRREVSAVRTDLGP
jgi:hypothetical protein